jgi:hypothetical protein
MIGAILRGVAGWCVLLVAALVESCLAALAALACGGAICLVWYIAIEGAPDWRSLGAAWRADAPIPTGLFLLPCLTVLAAFVAAATRFAGALRGGANGRRALRWLPRLSRLLRGDV